MTASKRILVIDDDSYVIDFCETVLEAEGYTVIGAADGATGVTLAQRESPDVIILDIMMEEQDTGLKLAETLGREAPVILLSNIAAALDQVFDTTTLPIKGIVNKPIKPDELIERVRRLVKR